MKANITKTCRELVSMALGTEITDSIPWQQFGDAVVTGLCYDSRLASPASIFFCLVGARADGHTYASAAYRTGCRLFVVERTLDLPQDCLQILVPNTRTALADCAAAFYDHPERHLRLVGITGTKGKTTTAIFLRTILEEGGIPTGYIGTNGVEFADEHYDTLNSTPESLEIYRYLRLMVDNGIRACVMEVSSQALWMGRVRGLTFEATAFLNLSRDHIGGAEHPDMAHYKASKQRLFSHHTGRMAIFNADDPCAADMASATMNRSAEGNTEPLCLTFSTNEPALAGHCTEQGEMPLPPPCHTASEIRADRHGAAIGTSFICDGVDRTPADRWFLPLPGDFNVQNALAALTVAHECFGVPIPRVRHALANATVPGRFETVIHEGAPGTVFVIDYAHNGASLTAILDALRDYQPNRLIALFGSVGGRTFERRRDLAMAAGPRCDLCILTADNPASEPVENILAEIDAAFPPDSCPRVHEPDRACAIRLAVDLAQPGDMILLAGKGHEDYQLIGTQRVPFSDGEILRAALEEKARDSEELPI